MAKFTKIQDAETKNIIQYLVNNKRVSKADYNHWHYIHTRDGQQSCFLTDRTKKGNFRHTFYTSI